MDLIEQVQYKAALVVSGCWQGTSRVKLYNELGWESLSDRRWFRRLSLFYQIVNKQAPEYFQNHIPRRPNSRYELRKRRELGNLTSRTARYKNSCFPFCISEWEQLSDEIRSSPTLSIFKNKLLVYIRPPKNSSYEINDIPGMNMLTKLRVEFSDLRAHRFHHKFNCNDPCCSCLLQHENQSFYKRVAKLFPPAFFASCKQIR